MRKILTGFIFLMLLFAAGCGKETSSEQKSSTEQNPKSSEQISEGDKQANKKIGNQGDFNVILDGEIIYKDKQLKVSGKTNLLPDTTISMKVNPLDGILIGPYETDWIADDGSFEMEIGLPDNYGQPYVFVEIVYENEYSEQANEHYKNGEAFKGPFVREFIDEDKIIKRIAYTEFVPLDENGATIPIKAPDWKVPNDQGSPEVWIEAEIEKDEQFIYVYGKSNLIEAATVSGTLTLEGYMTFGMFDSTTVNPDGSFILVINQPTNDVAALDEYNLEIQFAPKKDEHPSVAEIYGEKGEKLQGNLVTNDDDSKVIILKQKLSK